jgi:hypothetical protein
MDCTLILVWGDNSVKTKVLVGTSLRKQPHGRLKKWESNSETEFVKIQVVFKYVNTLWQYKLEETPSGLGLIECFIITVTEPLVSGTTDLVHYLFVVFLWVK